MVDPMSPAAHAIARAFSNAVTEHTAINATPDDVLQAARHIYDLARQGAAFGDISHTDICNEFATFLLLSLKRMRRT